MPFMTCPMELQCLTWLKKWQKMILTTTKMTKNNDNGK
jgi:hypothetical protein